MVFFFLADTAGLSRVDELSQRCEFLGFRARDRPGLGNPSFMNSLAKLCSFAERPAAGIKRHDNGPGPEIR